MAVELRGSHPETQPCCHAHKKQCLLTVLRTARSGQTANDMNDVKGQTCQQPASNFFTHSMCKDALHTSCNKARQTTCHCLLFIKHCMEIRFKEEVNRQCKSLKLYKNYIVAWSSLLSGSSNAKRLFMKLPSCLHPLDLKGTGLKSCASKGSCGSIKRHLDSSGWSLDPYDPPINYSSVRFIIQIK